MDTVRMFPGTVGTREMHNDLPVEDDDKYYIRVTASNAEVDSHHSVMDPKTSLKNFEADAKLSLGVALKDHHAHHSFGYGRSTGAKLTDDNALIIDFFILKDMEYSDASLQFKASAQLIRSIEQGLVNQVSIAYFGAREICNLCEKPIKRFTIFEVLADKAKKDTTAYCEHEMGKSYEIADGGQRTATYTVYDARLMEVSLVEYGSNRHTSIEKRMLEEILMTDTALQQRLSDALDIPDLRETDEPDAFVDKLQTELASLREQNTVLTDKLADLKDSAEDGKAYRQDRIDEAVRQGIRAYGDAFDEAYHRAYYADLPLEKIQEHIDHNKKKADTVLPAGRSTTDTHTPPAKAKQDPEKKQARIPRRHRRLGR